MNAHIYYQFGVTGNDEEKPVVNAGNIDEYIQFLEYASWNISGARLSDVHIFGYSSGDRVSIDNFSNSSISTADAIKNWSHILFQKSSSWNDNHRVEVYDRMDGNRLVYSGNLDFGNENKLCLIPMNNMEVHDDQEDFVDTVYYKKIHTYVYEDDLSNLITLTMEAQVKIYNPQNQLLFDITVVLNAMTNLNP